MSAPKFCKDCRWYERSNIYSTHLRVCRRPDPLGQLVGGPTGGMGRFCTQERSQTELCGPDGRFFAPQPPTGWRRLRFWLAGLWLVVLPGCASAPAYADAGALVALIVMAVGLYVAAETR